MENDNFFTVAPSLEDVYSAESEVKQKENKVHENIEKTIDLKCPNCNNDIDINQKYCGVCGYLLNQPNQENTTICPKCGNAVGINDSFCQKCGHNLKQINKKRTFASHLSKRMVIIISCIAIFVLLFTVISISISNNSPKNKIIGEWSTERGLDSRNYSFKSNGNLIYSEFAESRTYKYSFKGDTLVVSNKYGSDEYVYSSLATSSDYSSSRNYWYIKGDVLYFRGLTLYKQ